MDYIVAEILMQMDTTLMAMIMFNHETTVFTIIFHYKTAFFYYSGNSCNAQYYRIKLKQETYVLKIQNKD